MSPRRDLIVPVHDRRRRKRIVTLKHARIVLLIVLALFVGLNIFSELRRTPSGNYGRLVGHELAKAPKVTTAEVVREASPQPVEDQTAADPMLVAPMAREQWLHEQRPASEVAAVPIPAPVPVQAAAAGESETVVVGDATGVAIVKRTRRRPVLAGGFGR